MTHCLRRWYWKLAGASLLVMGGAIAESGDRTLAQIAPDDTLGAESSVVTPTNINGIPSDRISGGAIRGANLFHSFEKFSVPTGSAAYFNNALDIQNIISRVTGESISNIDGLLRSNGTANLFLLNPNGIIFGPNASLNIGGSFLASTASTINFADGTQFSATTHPTTPLLTVSVPIGLQYEGNAGSIRNQSQATNSSSETVGLQVPPSKTLALVGGNVSLDGGNLQAPGGRVELGGVFGAGTLRLSVDRDNLGLSFPVGGQIADVFLTNGADVYVSDSGGGSIAINARNLNVLGGSKLRAGIASGLGSVDAQAGDITLNAQQAITIANNSLISNAVLPRAVGNSGDINIKTGSFSVTEGAFLTASTFGQGDAGDVLIDAQDRVSLDNGVITNQVVGKHATGNGGDIRISTGSLTATNIGLLQAFTIGRGNAGSIIIKARDLVVFQGASEDGRWRSGAVSIAGDGAAGSGGNVEITTRSVAIIDRASVSASTKGQGNAGNVIINALENISLDNSSTIFSAVEKNAEGRAGNINITTGSLSLTNGGQLDASTFGQNNSGNIIVTARDTISLDGISPNKAENASTIFTEVFKNAQGDGGNIQISTGSLLVTNEGQLDAKTRGRGNAGNIFITARDTVLFDGTSVTGKRSARALSRVDQGAEGSGGSIEITTGSLTLNNGAQLLANTLGKGDAGSVIVNARDSVTFDGSRTDTDGQSPSAAFSSVDEGGEGNGGNVQIAARSLSVTNGARLSAESRGQGDAGSLEVMADSIRLSNQASLIANTTAGQGNIILRSGDLVLRRGSNITTNATGTGTGGNITIDTGVLAALENSDISANAQDTRGGRVIIDAQGIFGTDFRENLTLQSDITASSKLGPQFSGTVEINTPDVDPSQGLVTLPAELVDASGVIASGCRSGGRQGESRFIVTGRGGLPIRPQDAYISPYPTGTVRSIPSSGPSSETPLSSVEGNDPSTNPIIAAPTQIVEARGWVINASGEVVLTASAPTVNPHIPSMTPAKCHAPETSS